MRTSLLVAVLAGLVALVPACGGRSGGTDGGASDAGSDAHASDAGSDAGRPDAGPSCPATLPAAGVACPTAEGQVCIYGVCPAEAFHRATCIGGAWSRDALACDHTCDDGTVCHGGEICVQRRSGAVITTCEANPCGSGPLDCGCAASVCGGGVCQTSGIDVTCTIDCGGCP